MLDRELLRIFRLDVTAACANVRLHIEASHLFSLTEEVDMANSIELAMVPESLSGAAGSLQWSGHYRGAEKGGSDFVGVYPLAESKVMVVIGDSVGYELAGTMTSAVVKSCCDEVMRVAPETTDPATLLRILNSSLHRDNRPALASCLAMLFDGQVGQVTYANAGHLPPYAIEDSQSGAGTRRVLAATGPLLGDLEHPKFKLHTSPLPASACFIMLTDGCIDRRDVDGEAYGYRRFHRLIKSLRCDEPELLRDTLTTAIDTHGENGRYPGKLIRDDEALLIVRNA